MAIQTIGIVGSGIMGRGIAEVCILKGYDVVLRSRSTATAEKCRAAVQKRISGAVARGKLEQATGDEALARLRATDDVHALAACDLVIETIVEDFEEKAALFRQLDEVVKGDAVFATNTSTLSVTELAVVTKRPERVVGIHFFNPAPVMKLVEVVPSLTTGTDALLATKAFIASLDKEAVEVKDQAGFVVNALLFPYLNHAVRLLDTGVATKEGIDSAMRLGCGHPMGPLALLDLVGIDTSVAIMNALYAEFAEPTFAPAPLLRRMVAAGKLGRKTGEGFYVYGND